MNSVYEQSFSLECAQSKFMMCPLKTLMQQTSCELIQKDWQFSTCLGKSFTKNVQYCKG